MQDDVRSQVLSTIPYGFYVVGTLDPDGTANGLTVNWALQTSFEPPQIAVAIERGGNAHLEVWQADDEGASTMCSARGSRGRRDAATFTPTKGESSTSVP